MNFATSVQIWSCSTPEPGVNETCVTHRVVGIWSLGGWMCGGLGVQWLFLGVGVGGVVWGLGFRVEVLGFRVESLGFRFEG